MIEGVPDFALLVPGADWHMNAGRRIDPSLGFVAHTTQGRDSRGLGSGRHHNTPGTFNHLNHPAGWYTYYPDWVRCSHAAGGNYWAPGVEHEGFTGERLDANQLRQLGQYIDWRHEQYKRDQHVYLTGDPRVWLDKVRPIGTYAHRKIAYPPQPSLQHYDEIHPSDYADAFALGTPTARRDEDMATVVSITGVGGRIESYLEDGGRAVHHFTGNPGAYGFPQDALDYAAATHPGILISPDELAAMRAVQGGGGGPVTVQLDAKALLDALAARLSA